MQNMLTWTSPATTSCCAAGSQGTVGIKSACLTWVLHSHVQQVCPACNCNKRKNSCHNLCSDAFLGSDDTQTHLVCSDVILQVEPTLRPRRFALKAAHWCMPPHSRCSPGRRCLSVPGQIATHLQLAAVKNITRAPKAAG